MGLVLGLLCMTYVLSQSSYKFPQKFDKTYNFHPEAALTQFGEEKDDARKKAIEKYIINFVYSEQYKFDNNQIYMNWNEAEVYLIKLLDSLFDKKTRNQRLDIFMQRSHYSNAYASRYGNIYFNIGMLCEAEDEAFLATILSHEAAHYLLGHKVKELEMRERIFGSGASDYSRMADFYKSFQKYELQADSFSIEKVVSKKLDFESVMKWHESQNAQEDVFYNDRTFKNMLSASSLSAPDFKKKKALKYNAFASHPSYLQRFENFKRSLDNCEPCEKRFFVDSVYFFKLRRAANEERKKISFERCDFNSCLFLVFKEYLNNNKSVKNYYYLMECIRRLIYSKPDLKDVGFLTEYIDDSELGKYNSVLHKPDYLFSSFEEYELFKGHPFISNSIKPFESYKDAFLYFAKEALSKGINEANLSLGLFYFSEDKKDSVKKYLNQYVSNGNGSAIDLAKSILKTGAPSVNKGKQVIIYNNVSHYTGTDFNYYLALKKKNSNSNVVKALVSDTSRTSIIMVNELLGSSPEQLYTIQKIIASITSLYSNDDIEMCKKIRLTSHFPGETDDIPMKFKKNFLIYSPEWYTWMVESRYDKILYLDFIYQYKEYMKDEEYYNNYLGYYLDINVSRPFFKDPLRSGFVRKKKDIEMWAEINEFLYK